MKDALALSEKQSQTVFSQFVRDVCSAVDSPRSLAVWLLFSYREHVQLLELEVNPLNYQDPNCFSDDLLVTSFLSKYPHLETGIDTEKVAMANFDSFELKCKETNAKLKFRLQSSDRAVRVFRDATEKCKRFLPVLDVSSIEEIFRLCAWGPGVTSAVKGNSLAAYCKFQGSLEATPDLIAAGIHNLVNSIPMWSTYHASGIPDNPSSVTPTSFKPVPGNAVIVVPKNAKTDRTIAVEPHVNAFLQRGIGKYLRQVLRKRGFDLRDQTRNQNLARKGSFDGSLATVDLKGASDTISQEVVREFLPHDWFVLLDASRSKVFFRDGGWHRYHKHSSMGNGYTFELETLIFATIALASCAEVGVSTDDVSVYGDDVILPVEAYDVFKETLSLCGFAVNTSKTFSSGPFRESCGKDFFLGRNVRPFFVREKLSSAVALYRVANNLRRYCAMRLNGMGYDGRFKRAWTGLYLACPVKYRFRCPDGVGDPGFVSEWDESCSSIAAGPSGPFGPTWRSKGLTFKARSRTKENSCLSVASTLYDLENRLTSGVGRDDIRPTLNPQSPTDRSKFDLREAGSWRVRPHLFLVWPYGGGWV